MVPNPPASAAVAERGRTDRRAILGLVLAFLLLLPAITVRLNASDEIQYFAWLRSVVFDHDINFDNEYRHFHDQAPDKHAGLRATFIDDVNEAGRKPNFTPIGTALLWSPFYFVGHVAAIVTGAPLDGFSYPYLAAVTYGSAIYGLLSLLLAADLTRRVFAVPAGVAAWVAWLGTPLIFYMYVAPGFSHAASAFVVALFLWAWVRVRGTWTPAGAAMLGACAALLPMIREQDVFFVLGPAIDFGLWAVRGMATGARSTGEGPGSRVQGPTVLLSAVTGVGAAALVYLPQVFAYVALNGHFGPTSKVTRKMSWSSPHFFGVLASPEHGLLFWTPMVLLATAGLAWVVLSKRAAFTADQRWMAALLIVMSASQAYISGAVESWTVAGSFGQRRFVAITPILVAGIALIIYWAKVAEGSTRRFGVSAVVLLAIWWNIGLMALFGLHLMDRQRLELGPNAAAVFWEFPRQAPGIVWRYLTARESLYDLPHQD